VHREILQVGENLRGELPSGREDECASRAARLVDQPVQDREQEGGRLPAARLRRREQVAPVEGRRNGIGLDRRRPGEPEIPEGAEQGGMELKSAEGQRESLNETGRGLHLSRAGRTCTAYHGRMDPGRLAGWACPSGPPAASTRARRMRFAKPTGSAPLFLTVLQRHRL
jgi:hypothetical protein